ncbi:hypothetical protein [Nocardiopsis sp. YSL2]|uniref:hypothetical protein n=1 Tax=Nocardiopsis sp. YSL2 TaxID=2939492 RepID=UPI0026F4178D|nr:hypothetical protein [Nocardiopsis sp. YSL2]
MRKHPTAQVLSTDDGPMALIRGTTDEQVQDRLSDLLASNPGYAVPHHWEWDTIRAGWLRVNPCPPACGTHRGHYDPARPGSRGAFQGALIDLTEDRRTTARSSRS